MRRAAQRRGTKDGGQTGRSPISIRRKIGERPVCPHISRSVKRLGTAGRRIKGRVLRASVFNCAIRAFGSTNRMSSSITRVVCSALATAALSVSQQWGSCSMQAKISKPASRTPMSMPPAPENRDRATLRFTCFLLRAISGMRDSRQLYCVGSGSQDENICGNPPTDNTIGEITAKEGHSRTWQAAAADGHPDLISAVKLLTQ
jgi:hypothetical protein